MRRKVIQKITPANGSPVSYRIVKQARKRSLAETQITYQRKASTTESKNITIVSNLPVGAIKITKQTPQPDATQDRFTLSNTTYTERNAAITITANRANVATAPTRVSTDFVITTNGLAGLDFGIDETLRARLQPLDLDMSWVWNFGVAPNTQTEYIFPWNTTVDASGSVSGYTPARITITSNEEPIYFSNHSKANNPKTVTVGTSTISGATYTTPVTFDLDKENWSVSQTVPYRVYFRGSNVSEDDAMAVTIRRGVQEFSRTTPSQSETTIGRNGVAQTTTTAIKSTVTSNVEWRAAVESSATWLKVKYGASGSWTSTVNQNDKVYAASTSNSSLSKTGELYFAATAITALNSSAITGDYREGTVTFTNQSYNAVAGMLGANVVSPTTTITQYKPVLRTRAGSTLPEVLPTSGGQYTINATTNLAGWSVVAYQGAKGVYSSPVTLTKGSSSPTVSATQTEPVNASMAVTVPANSTSPLVDRNVSL